MTSASSTASSRLRFPAIRQPLILQFKVAFHYDKDLIEIPGFYQRQWLPNYPEIVEFKYDGATYEIQVRQHKSKLYFADGLTRLRTKLQIYESVIVNFLACDYHSKFDLHFTPPLHQQTCKRRRTSRKHIWTYEITQSMLGAPYPLQLPPSVTQCLIHCGDHMTILRRFRPPLQWNVVVLDKGIGDKYITQPWYGSGVRHREEQRRGCVDGRDEAVAGLILCLIQEECEFDELSSQDRISHSRSTPNPHPPTPIVHKHTKSKKKRSNFEEDGSVSCNKCRPHSCDKIFILPLDPIIMATFISIKIYVRCVSGEEKKMAIILRACKKLMSVQFSRKPKKMVTETTHMGDPKEEQLFLGERVRKGHSECAVQQRAQKSL
ncbi:hypothetical protein JHK87_022557 [Glycine soja]|nr:hypothetical protein JHK87_022557 [Glycine soja]